MSPSMRYTAGPMATPTSGAFFVVAGITFMAAGLIQGHTAFMGVGAAFIAIGAGAAAKARRAKK
jgi:hypothetical protein